MGIPKIGCEMLSDPDLIEMQSLSEEDFTKKYVIPMFEERGYDRVIYNHGQREHGRDLVAFKTDSFGLQELIGAQIKIGNVDVNMAPDLITDAIQALITPYYDLVTNMNVRIQKFFIITSGKFTDPCKEELCAGTSELYAVVKMMEGEEVLRRVKFVISSYMTFSKADKLMSDITIYALSEDKEFLEKVDKMLIGLVRDLGVSPLQCIETLPKLLIADPDVKSKLDGKDFLDRNNVLHWFSIRLIIKAWQVYGKSKKFSVLESIEDVN